MNTLVFLSNFSVWDILAKIQDISPKVWFPWASRHIPNFWDHPLHTEDPHPTGRYPDKLRKLLPATGVIWALWAQSWKKSPKMSSRGLSAPGPKTSKTESKESENRPLFNYFNAFSTPFSTFWAPGLRELIFRLFFQLWGRRAQMMPVAGKSFPNEQKNLGFCVLSLSLSA